MMAEENPIGGKKVKSSKKGKKRGPYKNTGFVFVYGDKITAINRKEVIIVNTPCGKYGTYPENLRKLMTGRRKFIHLDKLIPRKEAIERGLLKSV